MAVVAWLLILAAVVWLLISAFYVGASTTVEFYNMVKWAVIPLVASVLIFMCK